MKFHKVHINPLHASAAMSGTPCKKSGSASTTPVQRPPRPRNSSMPRFPGLAEQQPTHSRSQQPAHHPHHSLCAPRAPPTTVNKLLLPTNAYLAGPLAPLIVTLNNTPNCTKSTSLFIGMVLYYMVWYNIGLNFIAW